MGEFGARMTKLMNPVKDVFSAFFDIKQEEGAREKGKKVAFTAARRITYLFADYWLSVLFAIIVIALKAWGLGFPQLFFSMWIFDIIVASSFVLIWKRTGNDLTLGADFRRATDVIFTKSRFLGIVFILIGLVKASFWDGPEYVVIFFRKEIGTGFRMMFVLFILTALQALLWTLIYSLGYESVSELIRYLRAR